MNSPKVILKQYFGYGNFLPGQEEVINSILEGKNTLAVMPTGGGKSLCYQVPALILPGAAIIISPLIALMKDQVDALLKHNVSAAFINSTLDENETAQVMNDAAAGKYKLLYIAPERLKSQKFLRILEGLKVSFLAVDEAHCISEWGHDFRPSYLEIKKITEIKRGITIAALTATATPDVQNDIINQLAMRNTNRIIRGFNRPNLAFNTELCKNKIERVQDIIKAAPGGSHIIYCGSRKKVDKTAMKLREAGMKVLSYHAGYDDKYRRQVQEEFFGKKEAVIVATNAFGLGIDKPNVRTVTHLDLTSTLEAYYQEAGRAGRDGNSSSCYILYEPIDRRLQQFFIDCSYPQKEDFMRMFNYMNSQAVSVGNSPENNFDLLSPENIAKEIDLPLTKVATILKIFEDKEVLTRRYSTNATIQFLMSYDDVRELLDVFDGKMKNTLEILLRYFGAAPFQGLVNFNLNDISQKYNIGRNVLLPVLKQFVFKGIISFSEEKDADHITMNSNDSRLQDFGLDFVQINARRDAALTKLQTVENFVFTRECKRNYILNYFGETDYRDTCGKCSSCRGDNGNLPMPIPEIDENDLSSLLEVVQNFNGEFAKSVIIDFVLGNSTKATTIFGRDESPMFGIFAKHNTEYVEALIHSALEKKLIEYSEEKYHPLILSSGSIKSLGKPKKPLKRKKFMFK